LKHPDGRFHHSLVSKFSIPDPDTDAVMIGGMAIDISEQVRAEEALRDADRRKDEFLAMLAHELRNPLTPIRSGLDILAAGTPLPSESVRLMQYQVEHLVRLVDDLLDVSRIMRGKIELRKQPVEIRGIAKQAVEALQYVVNQRSHELVVQLPGEPLYLDADPIRILQIIENLINNACKYTDPGGRIVLAIERQDRDIVLSVADSGIGIEPELLPRVFDLFTQSPQSLDRSQGGLGIGLTLVKTLTQMHGGSVTASSDGKGKGSTFVVRLPIGEPQPAEGTPEAQPVVGSRRRILLVDDNIGAARMLSILLTRLHSHVVEVAHDGHTALDKVNEFRPDVILLDIGLPGLDGYQVGRQIRENAEFDHVLLVALTGYGQAEDRRKSASIGFDAHIVKPPSMDDIHRILTHPKLARTGDKSFGAPCTS
jgi:CheY-like chemotaxis protein